MDNPFVDGNDETTLSVIVDMIQKVIKTPSMKTGDTGRFHIYIDGHDLTLTATQLAQGPGRFKTLFFDAFGKILYAKNEQWPKFAECIAEVAKPGDLEETAAVMAGDLLFERIATTMDLTDDKNELLKRENCRILVQHKPNEELYLCLPASVISEMIAELPIKASIEDISEAMTARGYKRAKTHGIKTGSVAVRSWWFIYSKILEHQPQKKEDLGGYL